MYNLKSTTSIVIKPQDFVPMKLNDFKVRCKYPVKRLLYPCSLKAGYLGVLVEVPEVQSTHAVHAGKQGRVDGRPLHVVHIVTVVLKRVDVLLVLQIPGRKDLFTLFFKI